MQPTDLQILYESGPCLVVNKPGGLLTQAPPEIDSLEVRIKRFLKVRGNKPGKVYLGVPHRLDRPVSGAMVFATHVRAARRLSEQFEGRLVRKTYWALVSGAVEPAEGTWTDYLRKVEGEPRSVVVDRTDPEGRIAILHYRVRAWDKLPVCVEGSSEAGSFGHADVTWLKIELETGRTHQIRVQAASRGFPLLGDELYGSRVSFGPQTVDERLRWIALHARSLAFRHPMTGEEVAIEAPLPAGGGWAAATASP